MDIRFSKQHPNTELIHAFWLVTYVGIYTDFCFLAIFILSFTFGANVIDHIICTLYRIYTTVTRSHIRNNKLFVCCFVKSQHSKRLNIPAKSLFQLNSIRYRPALAKHSNLHYSISAAMSVHDCKWCEIYLRSLWSRSAICAFICYAEVLLTRKSNSQVKLKSFLRIQILIVQSVDEQCPTGGYAGEWV